MNPLFRLCCILTAFTLAPTLFAQPATIHLDRGSGPAHLSVSGEPGHDYRVEGSLDPASASWDFLATLSFPSDVNSGDWLDAQSGSQAQRFYRAVQLPPAEPQAVQDFRLIDQQDRTRWLFYSFGMPSVRAVVLIFTGNGCAKFADMVPTIKALTNRFGGQGVLFWMVDSNTGDNRSNILAQATSLGLSNGPPILHDAAQLVARAYQASGIPEAVAINMASLSVFYRGAIDDRLGANPIATTQYYLSNALTQLLAGEPVSPNAARVGGCGLTLAPPYANLSYATDIAPLLQARCVRCHSPGNIAPWSMTNYDAVVSQSSFIRDDVMTGRMPPWHADPFYGRFTNDTSLKPDEAAKIVQWINDGAQRGTGSDPLADQPPPATNYPAAWPASLGPPDAILRIPVQSIPASGVIEYRYISVTNLAFNSDVWLRAAVARPGNTRVVHHCLVFEGDANSSLGGLAGFYAGYVPGFDPTTFPPGTGKLLKKGQLFTFQMHYIAVGTAQTDQTELGLYVTPVPPSYPLQTKAAYNVTFIVPANTADYQVTAQYPVSGTLTTNIVLYEMSPHMHLRGSRFRYEVVYPTGARETLISVPNYIFHWQTMYRFNTPKYIPRGSRIICTGAWDNTEQNPELMQAYVDSGNPGYLPDHSVHFDQQSWDEMFIGYLNYAEVPGPIQ